MLHTESDFSDVKRVRRDVNGTVVADEERGVLSFSTLPDRSRRDPADANRFDRFCGSSDDFL